MRPSTLISLVLSLAYTQLEVNAAPACKHLSGSRTTAPTGLALSELPVAVAVATNGAAIDETNVGESLTSVVTALPDCPAPTASLGEEEDGDIVYATVTEEVLITLQPSQPKSTVTITLLQTRTITPGGAADATSTSSEYDATAIAAPTDQPSLAADPTAPIAAAAETEGIVPISTTVNGEATLPVESTGIAIGQDGGSIVGGNLAAEPSATESPIPVEAEESGSAEGNSVEPVVVTVLSTTSVPVVTDVITEGPSPSATIADSSAAQPTASAGAGMGCNATTPGVAGNGKAGLGWNKDSGSCSNDFLQEGSKVSWGWNWGPNQDVVSPYIEFVPTLFSPGDYEAMIVASMSWPESTKNLISLYEPHLDIRGNLTVEEAVAVQQKLSNETALADVKIGGPVMSQDLSETLDAAKGWYSNFTSLCEGCKIDFLPLAFYSNNVDFAIGSISDWYNTFGAITGKKVWLVETNCRDLASGTPCSADAAAHYATILLQWAENTEWIERYSWYDTFTTDASDNGNGNALVTSTGHLSDLGRYYAYGS